MLSKPRKLQITKLANLALQRLVLQTRAPSMRQQPGSSTAAGGQLSINHNKETVIAAPKLEQHQTNLQALREMWRQLGAVTIFKL